MLYKSLMGIFHNKGLKTEPCETLDRAMQGDKNASEGRT
jgi:hypothetical protein